MWLRANGKTILMKRLALLAVALLLVLQPPPLSDAATIDTNIVANYNHAVSLQRHNSIYDNSTGRWFFFYYNGTGYNYKSSTDLTTFSAKHQLFAGYNFRQITGTLDVKQYGTSKVLVCVNNNTFHSGIYYNEVYFVNGTISGSSITWSTVKLAANYTTGFASTRNVMTTCTVSTNDGSTIWIGVNNVDNTFTHNTFKSTDGGVTWAADLSVVNTIDGGVVVALPSSQAIYIYCSISLATCRLVSRYYNAGWGLATSIFTDYLRNNCCSPATLYGPPFSVVIDPLYPSRVHLTYINNTGFIKYVVYNSGWGSGEVIASNTYTNITQFDYISFPVLAVDSSNSSTVIAWAKNDVIYERTRYSDGTLSSISVVANETSVKMPRERDLTGGISNVGNKILYTYLTGSGTPFNLTLASMNQAIITTTTTSTTATVTTLTTQTTTADTIVDAVANQFAAVMENLFPALIIILVFVYLAYKAGASGEVLAYVFIITLVLTSFVNLMPWWITIIVSVIMIAILLNYRQRGGGVPQ